MSNLLISSGTLAKLVDSGQILPEDGIDMMFSFPKSLRERVKKNMGTMKKVQESLQQAQEEVRKEKEKNDLLMNFLLSIDRGGEIKQAFDTTFQMATMMMEKMKEQEQQQAMPPDSAASPAQEMATE
jgi:hypothetical protein